MLLQLRAGWTHQGGSWGLPGGARDSHEDVVAAALREAAEEAGSSRGACVWSPAAGVDHGDWSYTYVVAIAGPRDRGPGPTTRATSSAGSGWPRWTTCPCTARSGGVPALRPVIDEAVTAARGS